MQIVPLFFPSFFVILMQKFSFCNLFCSPSDFSDTVNHLDGMRFSKLNSELENLVVGSPLVDYHFLFLVITGLHFEDKKTLPYFSTLSEKRAKVQASHRDLSFTFTYLKGKKSPSC